MDSFEHTLNVIKSCEEACHLFAAKSLRQSHLADYEKLIKFFDELKPELNKVKGLTFDFHHRLKSINGIKDRLSNPTLGKEKLSSGSRLNDIIGFRLTNPWTKNIHLIANEITSRLNIISSLVTEKGRVIYLFGETDQGHAYEIQLWTSMMYHCFEFEHDRVYKSKGLLSDEQKKKSALVRDHEHKLQDIIDENVIV